MIIKLTFASIFHNDSENTIETLVSEFQTLNMSKNPLSFLNTIQLVEVVGNNKYYSIRTQLNSNEIEEHDHHHDRETAVNIFHTTIELYKINLLS